MGLKYIIFPVPLYDGGGWLNSDISDSSYNKLNKALGYAGPTLNTLGMMLNDYGQYKYNNQSIFLGLGADEILDKLPKIGEDGKETGEYTYKPTGLYTYSKPLSKSKQFGLRTEGFYIKDNGDGTYRISKDLNLLNNPKYLANGGWSTTSAILGTTGDALTNYSEAAGIDNGAVLTSKTLIKNDVSTPVTANSFDSLMEEAANMRNLKTNWSKKDMKGGSSFSNIAKGTLKSIGSGIKTASTTGSWWGGLASAGIGIASTILGDIAGSKEAEKQADYANQYGNVANMYRQYKIADAVDRLKGILEGNYLRGYAAEGGQLYTGNFLGLMPEEDKVSKFQEMVKDDNRIGIDSVNLGELSENQEIDGLSLSDIRKLRKAGYKFDIIG